MVIEETPRPLVAVIDPRSTDPTPNLFLSVFLLSAAILGYEVLLTRIFSIIQWHHYAYMIVSLALLGFGVSGVFLTIFGPVLVNRFETTYACLSVLFAVTMAAGFLAAQQVPFNALSLVWEPTQALWLALIYLILMVPFFFAASCLGLVFMRFTERIRSLYALDLFGAGFGAAGVIGLLVVVDVEVGLLTISIVSVAASVVCLWHLLRLGARLASLMLIAALLGLSLWGDWLEIKPSEFKGLTQALRVVGARVIDKRSSPLGTITVVENHQVPFRHAPGLSVNAPAGPPEQVGVFIDGDSMSVITRADGDAATLAYLDFMITAAPYHLVEGPSVLIIGAGGGGDVLQALRQGARRVDAVELNGDVVDIVLEKFSAYSGGVFTDPRVGLHVAEARSFIARTPRRYDVIQIALLDSFSASAAGLYALSENHLYTVEAIQALLDRLEPGGLLAITRWAKLPPRDGPKLFATMLKALEEEGVAEPASQLVWIRDWSTNMLLLRNGQWNREDSERLRAFCHARSFDVVHFPGMGGNEPNRYNQLTAAHFAQAAAKLISEERDSFIAAYKFDIRPALDDRPYFFSFFRWASLRELIELRVQGGAGLLDAGYLIVFLTLVQGGVLSLVLIGFPLWWIQRRAQSRSSRQVWPWRALIYFGGIGVGFLMIEIVFIQRLVQFLGHPVFAVAVVLSGFLVFAGVGAGLSRRYETGSIVRIVRVLVLIGLLYVAALPLLVHVLAGLPIAVKILLAGLCLLPIAVPMGTLFPLGLAEIARTRPELVPWAWGVNGCASVISAPLAVVLATHIGFSGVMLAAVALYALVGWAGRSGFAGR